MRPTGRQSGRGAKVLRSNTYVWRAIDAAGKIKRGTATGVQDPAGLRLSLREDGYLPLQIRPHWTGVIFALHRRPPDWAYFCRHLATVLGCGISLAQGLAILASHAATRAKREHWRLVRDKVDAGEALSETIPGAPMFVCSMIRAGERTGTLANVLAEVANELENDRRFRNRMTTALAYPSLLLGTLVLVFWALAVWVLPMYKQLFAGFEADLPHLTQVVFAVGQRIPWVVGTLVFFGIAAFMVMVVRNPRGRRADFYGLVARLPVIGPVYRLGEQTQFIGILGRLLRAGIPLLEALQQAGGTARSHSLRKIAGALVDSVYQGKRMAPVLRRFKVFPADACEMLAVAEDTGQLGDMLTQMERVFHDNLERRMERMVQMIEPLLIIGMAGVIGITAVAFLLPVFDVSTHLQ